MLAACGSSGTTDGDDAAGDGGSADGGDAASAACEVGETDGDLVFYNWSDYIDPELITQFEEEAGVSVSFQA